MGLPKPCPTKKVPSDKTNTAFLLLLGLFFWIETLQEFLAGVLKLFALLPISLRVAFADQHARGN
jgi:hypothetical protein